MAHEYVFRGERKPFAPDPQDEQAREAAKQEAEALVRKERPIPNAGLASDAEIEDKLGDYQVGGLDAFGATAAPDSNERDSASPAK